MGFKGKQFSELRCGRCNWDFGNIFHICLDPTDPGHFDVHPMVGVNKGRKLPERSQDYRDAISAAQFDRWAKRREKERPRDEKIWEYYNDHIVSLADLAKKFKITKHVARRVLQEGFSEGRVNEIRKRGLNLAYDNKGVFA